MAARAKVIKRSLKILKQFQSPAIYPAEFVQRATLFNLIKKSKGTAFGRHHGFDSFKEPDLLNWFRDKVPVHTYNDMWEKWWHRCQLGEENVAWPGKVKYFALSSGTSESASKHIPVTADMIRSVNKVGKAQVFNLLNHDIPTHTFQKGVLMLGGTTALNAVNGYFEGDMSAISTVNMPAWLSSFYFKPGHEIARLPLWQDRIQQMVDNAHRWDIGVICGIPSWIQILLEAVIDHYGLRHIHEIWPNLNVYIHGGVAMDHYREQFKKLLGQPITYIETYMASEGSFGFKARPGHHGIKLALDAGVFFEFIPFNPSNFDENGNLKSEYDIYTVENVSEAIDYAVVITTCAGAWRYLIGDVVKFTDARALEIAIVGRTKQFLNLCGEHVSIDNINKTIELTAHKLRLAVGEFTVTALRHKNHFAHRWYVGCDNALTDVSVIRQTLDETLCALNDDYRVERQAALTEIFVEVLPNEVFHGFLKWMNKEGGMHKFPRVLKNDYLTKWEKYLAMTNAAPVSLKPVIA